MSADRQTSDCGPQSAQDILDNLYSTACVARVADHIQTGDAAPSPVDIRRTLALAEDRLCVVFEHDCGLEYVWLADGWQHFDARMRRDRDGETIDATLSLDDLEHRLSKLVDVQLVGATDVARPNGGDSA